jgi:hypothetical protein
MSQQRKIAIGQCLSPGSRSRSAAETWVVLPREVAPLSSATSVPKWGMLVQDRASQPRKTTIPVSLQVSTVCTKKRPGQPLPEVVDPNETPGRTTPSTPPTAQPPR